MLEASTDEDLKRCEFEAHCLHFPLVSDMKSLKITNYLETTMIDGYDSLLHIFLQFLFFF